MPDSMEAIEKLIEKKDVEGLLVLLSEGERDERVDAARDLGQLRDMTTLPALVEAMGDREVVVRQAAAEAITCFGSCAIPPLVETLQGEGRLAPYALWALGEIASRDAIDAITLAAESKSWRIRWSAIESLGNLGGQRAILALVQALDDRDPRVRNAARTALIGIGDPALKELTTALHQPRMETRLMVQQTLAGMHSPAARAVVNKEQLLRRVPVIGIIIGIILVFLWILSLIVW